MDAIKKGLREVSFAYKKKCLDTICADFQNTPTRVFIGLQWAGIDRGCYRL